MLDERLGCNSGSWLWAILPPGERLTMSGKDSGAGGATGIEHRGQPRRIGQPKLPILAQKNVKFLPTIIFAVL